jgi:hypothetical protein
VLAGLPESPQLARALARRSQLEMLRSSPRANEHAREAIEVARRVGDRFAEANARVNLFTSLASEGVVVPAAAEVHEIIELAREAGAYDEGYRAVVNYLWGAAASSRLDGLEPDVRRMLERLADLHPPESYAHYLEVSLAKLVWIPCGRWAEAERMLLATDPLLPTSNRMVELEVVAGMALRRGDLAAADEALGGFTEWALTSEEPQRVLPLAGVALPRAVVGGDLETVRSITAAILGFQGRARWAFYAPVAVPRALAAVGDVELLARFTECFVADGSAGTPLGRIVLDSAHGLLALAGGRAAEAAGTLRRAVAGETARGAVYEAACLELDLAGALEAAGDEGGAEAARARADAVLGPLGCVHAV